MSDLESGIKTEMLPEGFRVEWINWDSGFRKTELDIGDYILGVDGKPFDRSKHYQAVGQYAEYQGFQKPEITLNVVRDGKTFDVAGKLHEHYFYYDAEQKQALAPGGPRSLANDGFGDAWSSWLEKTIGKYSYALLRMWVQKSFNTRIELASHLESKDRIDFLKKTYPGPFADAMLEDWTRVMECLRGKKIELTEKDLEYRQLGEKRKEIAKEEAARAWKGLVEGASGSPFPAPSIQERGKVVGKTFEFPPVTYRNIVNDLGRAYMAIGAPSDGYYFVVLETPELFRFYKAMFRYKGQINPTMPERYRYLARVKDDPQMITVGGRSQMGLTLELLAVLAGEDECCVDLRVDPPKFAGEDRLSSFEPVVVEASAGPSRTIEAMVQAVKMGDEKAWRGCFADWRVVSGAGGRETIDASYVPGPAVFGSAWERSRKNILGEVLDARVERVEGIQRVLEPSEGLPLVEQARVWVDHFGRFDGEVRAYKNLYVNREWVLQRLNGGAWKIVSVQNL